jgi:hypothetical protein
VRREDIDVGECTADINAKLISLAASRVRHDAQGLSYQLRRQLPWNMFSFGEDHNPAEYEE